MEEFWCNGGNDDLSGKSVEFWVSWEHSNWKPPNSRSRSDREALSALVIGCWPNKLLQPSLVVPWSLTTKGRERLFLAGLDEGLRTYVDDADMEELRCGCLYSIVVCNLSPCEASNWNWSINLSALFCTQKSKFKPKRITDSFLPSKQCYGKLYYVLHTIVYVDVSINFRRPSKSRFLTTRWRKLHTVFVVSRFCYTCHSWRLL